VFSERRIFQNFDTSFFLLLLAISAISIINMYSATRSVSETIFKRHICWYILGFFCFFITSLSDYRILKRWSPYIYILSIILLIAVLVLGKVISGSQRWIRFGPFSFQPSEFAKLSLAITISSFFSEDSRKEYGLKESWKLLLLIIFPSLLILKEPDLGTAIIILIFSFNVILIAGIRKRTLVFLILSSLLLSPFLWMNLKEYQKKRIMAFIDPDSDPLGAGYHITQSKIAIGSGMLFGKGYMKGTQTRLHFLPEQHTDFIFSVFAEEWGFFGSLFLLSLYTLLVLKGIDIAKTSKDRFGRYLAISITCMIFWQIFINIGMVTGILPVVGTPLLFMSYGGSSLLFSMISAGILMSIRIRRFIFDEV